MTTIPSNNSRSPFLVIAILSGSLAMVVFASSGAFVLAPGAWFAIAALLILQGYFALAPDTRPARG
ncbi:MAG: hypothetical protein U0031_03215 [Thermomicrobiales bacterium]